MKKKRRRYKFSRNLGERGTPMSIQDLKDAKDSY